MAADEPANLKPAPPPEQPWKEIARLARALGRFGLRESLAALAAAASVPLAATVGIAAAAADALGRARKAPHAPDQTGERRGIATLLILNYEGRPLLEKYLPSVLAAVAHSGRPHEVLVVDNGSTDGSVELVRERFPTVRVLPLPKNIFFSAGNNAGFETIDTEWIVLLNNDMRVEPDFLGPLLQPFAAADDLFAVASQIQMADASARRLETGVTRGLLRRGRFELRQDAVPAGDQPIPILWAGGGACAISRSKLRALGGLDVLYDPFYCEDVDLSLRAWKRGWRVLLAADSVVHHEHRATSVRVFGESYVNEIFRRNLLLLAWVNLEGASLREHLLALPEIAFDEVEQRGLSGVRTLGRALFKVPDAMARRVRAGSRGVETARIFEQTEAGADPIRALSAPPRADGAPLRILLVSPYHLLPASHGGAVRMLGLVRGLAQRGHEVSVISVVTDDEHVQAARVLRDFCAEVVVLRPSEPSPRLVDPRPRAVREIDTPALRRAVAQVLQRRPIDVLQLEYTQLAGLAELAPGCVRCVTEIDIAYVALERAARAQSGLAQKRALLEAARMRRFEVDALGKVDLVFALSEHDAGELRKLLPGGPPVIGAASVGIDAAALSQVPRAPEEDRVLFVGNFAHPPNVDAALHLVRDVMPKVWSQRPLARLAIVGGNAPEAVRALSADARVEVAGYVESLSPHYSRAAVLAAPIRLGAGIRVKILEALAAGVPVVSTSAGAEGLPVEPGRELLLADGEQAFAAAIVKVLEGPALADRLSAAGRAFGGRYQFGALAEAAEAAYLSALARKRSAVSP